MNYDQFHTVNTHFCDKIITAAKTSSACLILVSGVGGKQQVSFIHKAGIDAQLIACYSNQLYKYDPHIADASQVLCQSNQFTRVISVDDQFDGGLEQDRLKYWAGLECAGIKETAACIRQVSENMWLLVGLLSDSPRHHMLCDLAARHIDDWLNECSHHLLEYCLNRLYFDRNDTVLIEYNSLLTPREKDVALQLIQGQSNKQISSHLLISEFTVENHLRRIYQKFGVHNRTSLIASLNQGIPGS